VTLASIIEKEAIGDDEERANISSVFYNRLSGDNSEIGTALQSDATIYYALHIAGMDDTQFSTDLDSPYNTYKHGGLPAGPICNPSLSSIKAAVHPNDTGYYYFAYGKDGVSHFFRTYDEHLAFVNSDMYAPD
ncbi:MAG: endolytic transglycosylase MltG, partial [Oscillospiraceae bacterium]|nr:endolytic transglycosylase MltG [Oscillospiraceae bacterium]